MVGLLTDQTQELLLAFGREAYTRYGNTDGCYNGLLGVVDRGSHATKSRRGLFVVERKTVAAGRGDDGTEPVGFGDGVGGNLGQGALVRESHQQFLVAQVAEQYFTNSCGVRREPLADR